jgi:hypothetical protein
MSKAYDRALDFLNKAIPLPPEVEVCCQGCGNRDRTVQLDEAGDQSPRGEFPYGCPDCGFRYTIDGYTRGEPKRKPELLVPPNTVLTPEQEAVMRHWYSNL